jgi:hypothetical protein
MERSTTLAIVALVEIALGLDLYLRTGPQVEGLLARLTASPTEFAAGAHSSTFVQGPN